MTKQEFLELTHQQEIDDELFEAINKVYMATGYEKDEFCKLWMGDKELLCYNLTDAIEKLTKSLTAMQKKAKTIAEHVLTERSDEAEQDAYYILGTAGAIKAKIADEVDLSDSDIDYINKNLQ